MADFKKRFKDLLGFSGSESVAYDETADDAYDYSDYETTEDYMEEEDYADDTFESSSAYTSAGYTTRASAGATSGIKSRASAGSTSRSSYGDSSSSSSDRSRVLSMGAAANLRVVLSKPVEYDDCQAICSHLRGHMTVVLNLESVRNGNDRRRIFDFVSGCCFALDCNIQRVSELIYVIAPCDVDVFSEAEDDEYEDTYSF